MDDSDVTTTHDPSEEIRLIGQLACGIAGRTTDMSIEIEARLITRLARDLEYDF